MELDGFNLHASVAIAGDDDSGRERLMRRAGARHSVRTFVRVGVLRH